METYLGSLNSAYRGAADQRQRIEQLARQAFGQKRPDLPPSGMPPTGPGEALRYIPTSYTSLRRAVGN